MFYDAFVTRHVCIINIFNFDSFGDIFQGLLAFVIQLQNGNFRMWPHKIEPMQTAVH